MSRVLLCTVACIALFAAGQATSQLPYQDTSLPRCCDIPTATYDQCLRALTPVGDSTHCDHVDPSNTNAGRCYACMIAMVTSKAVTQGNATIAQLTEKCLNTECIPDIVTCVCNYKDLVVQPNANDVINFMSSCINCKSVNETYRHECTCCVTGQYVASDPYPLNALSQCNVVQKLDSNDYCSGDPIQQPSCVPLPPPTPTPTPTPTPPVYTPVALATDPGAYGYGGYGYGAYGGAYTSSATAPAP